MAKKPPHIKAYTDGERICLQVERAGDRQTFDTLLSKIRMISAARFDWDEKVWHMPLTTPNAEAVLALASREQVEVAPLLAAWIADRSVLQRLVAVEAQLDVIAQHLGIDPELRKQQLLEMFKVPAPTDSHKPPF